MLVRPTHRAWKNMTKKDRMGREERKEGNLGRTGRNRELQKGELNKQKYEKKRVV